MKDTNAVWRNSCPTCPAFSLTRCVAANGKTNKKVGTNDRYWSQTVPVVDSSNGCADSTKTISNNGTFTQQIIWAKQQSEKQTVGLFIPASRVSLSIDDTTKNREKAANDSFHQQSLGKKYKIWFNQGSYLFLLAKTLGITFSQVHYLFLLCTVTVATCS